MTAEAGLLRIYEEWRSWTEEEREAIQAADWRRVAFCQKAKSGLQPQIVKQTADLHAESIQSDPDRQIIDRRLRPIINELIFLETRNGEILAQQHQRGRTELAALDRSGRTLGRMQKSYSAGKPLNWESYS